jgi:hypothetical protein
MLYDAGPPPAISFAEDRSARRKRPDLMLGVFSHEGAWKVYSQFEPPRLYATRQEAVAEAETRALAEARSGRRVEFFIQDEDGGLRQIDLH